MEDVTVSGYFKLIGTNNICLVEVCNGQESDSFNIKNL